MIKRIVAALLLALMVLTLCGCESKSARLQRKLDEATREAQEARERANKAQENLAILESILGK